MLFTFLVGSVAATQSAVDLGTAGNFAILAKSGISTTGTTSIVGNIGTSPIDSTAITGFGLTMDSTNEFSTSPLVTGKIYAADYTSPTSSVMTTAIGDMETAYADAAGRSLPDYTELGSGDIDGMTLSPGLYTWGTGVSFANGVTLAGGPNDVWIFQIAQDLTIGNGAIVTLSGGAQPKNIFWQVAGQATIGTTAQVKGIILSHTAIALNTGATLNGRALAQTAVTLDANALTTPSQSTTVVTSPSIPRVTTKTESSVKKDDETVIKTSNTDTIKTNPVVVTRDTDTESIENGIVTTDNKVDATVAVNDDDDKPNVEPKEQTEEKSTTKSSSIGGVWVRIKSWFTSIFS